MYSIPFYVEENSPSVLSRAPGPGTLLRLAIQSAFLCGIAEQISSEAEFNASLVIEIVLNKDFRVEWMKGSQICGHVLSLRKSICLFFSFLRTNNEKN